MNDACSKPLPGLAERRAPGETGRAGDPPAAHSEAAHSEAAHSEAALVAAARTGDRDALERLLTRHERSLYLLCLGVLGGPEDAEDAVQETFLRALRSLSRFRGEAGVRTWLARIAVNVCLEWKRRHRTKDAAERLLLDEPGASCPQAEALNRLCVFEALAAVSPRARAMLLLKEREGWTAGEIARATRATERQVYYELQKAYSALAEWRRAHQDEEERK